jgi:predicted ArsR family transcriptional regulator
MPESSNKGGRKPRVTDEDLLDVFRSTSDPVLSTAEVADAVPIKRRGTLNRLQALEEDGELESKQIGGRNTVWWFAGGERIAPDEREEDAEQAREVRDRRREDTPDAPESDRGDTVLEDALAGLDTIADRRDAVRACVEYLREQGTAQKSGFVDAVYPEHPAGFGSSGGWWNKIGKEYLRAVAEAVDVIAPPAGEGSHTWRYTGEA